MQAYTPKWSLSGGISYRIDIGIAEITPRVDASYRSKTYFDPSNTEQIAQPGYGLLNASIRASFPKSGVAVTASVTNLTNRSYRVSGNAALTSASGYTEATYGPPRMWALEVSKSF